MSNLMQPSVRRSWFWMPVCVLVSLVSCQSSRKSESVREPISLTAHRASVMESVGVSDAPEVSNETASNSGQALSVALKAFEEQRFSAMGDALADVDSEQLAHGQQQVWLMLKAMQAVQLGQFDDASRALQRVEFADQLPSPLRLSYWQLTADLAMKQKRFLSAAKAYMSLSQITHNQMAQVQLQSNIWAALQEVPMSELAESQVSGNGTDESGWLSLAFIMSRYGDDPKLLQQGIRGWQQRFPRHPGQAFLHDVKQWDQWQPPKHVAILLPEGGAHHKAANAIREGMMADFLLHRDEQYAGMQLRFYDTVAGGPKAAYLQAVANGADLVVGPLSKENVDMLSQLPASQRRTPILALNERENQQRLLGRFYQFSLNPEHEARLVARKAHADGKQTASIVVPNNRWGERVAQSFEREFVSLGGQVIATHVLDNKPDQSKTIQQLLNWDSSQSRSRRVKNLIKERVVIQPRRRQDLDVVFMAAPPAMARLVKPLFDFYYASDLPIYASSSIFSGQINPQLDKDMNRVTFCDMPWLIGKQPALNTLRQSLQSQWPREASHQARLHAMGVDALRLARQLHRLAMLPQAHIKGATGDLMLSPEQIITRQLAWARMENGVPVPLDE